MARRLAHEIKNPLTPIQLAVQEVHRRYSEGNAKYQQLLDTTLEIVEDEVATLRRLVSEFSEFARLPRAELREQDLAAFLRDQHRHLALVDDPAVGSLEGSEFEPAEHSADVTWGERQLLHTASGIELLLELEVDSAPTRLDRQMFGRALVNLVRNATQALAAQERSRGRVVLRLSREADQWALDVEDNGPGISEEMQETAFDPYITTKAEGTGLGLAIVKKIVMEHGGSVCAERSPLGGARIRICLPRSRQSST
jgi:two-component system, NtrC family, nitrogen regulation sensor histidine kinase NtrY